jgi:hypothetical protein
MVNTFKKYMGKILKLLIYFVGIGLVTSCLDEVKLKTRNEPSILIIEGLLTDNTMHQYLRLSQTTLAGKTINIEAIKGASVTVITKSGQKHEFGQSINELGLYYPKTTNFKGINGETYQLVIKLNDGREFVSTPQTMPNSVPIKSLKAVFDEKNNFGFNIYLNFDDPSQQKNYYRWLGEGYHQRKSVGVPVAFSVCCDRCWVLKEEKGVNIFSDNLTNGNTVKEIPVYFSPFYTLGKHLIEIRQLSISQETYQYWRKFKEQSTRTGTIFDPLPAPLFGNVINKNNPKDIALGYFEVSSITKKQIEPFDSTHGVINNFFDNELFVKPGDCMLAYPFSVYIGTNPPGWRGVPLKINNK